MKDLAQETDALAFDGTPDEPTEAQQVLADAVKTVETMSIDEAELVRFKPDDAGNAEAFALVFGQDYAFSTALGWLQWTGTHWHTQDADAQLNKDMVTLLRKRQAAAALAQNQPVVSASRPNNGRINAAIEQANTLLRVSETKFDTHHDLLNVRNGVVNLRTGKMQPHDKALKITHFVDTVYDPAAEQSLITDYLLQSVKGGQDVVSWLQMWLGYCLTGEKHIEQMLYMWGKPRAGKGTIVEAITSLMGPQLAKSVSFATFAEKREPDSQNFDLAGLKSARFVIADESPKAGTRNALDVEKVKRITGNTAIRCAHKHKEFFEYIPRFKIAIVSNFPLNADADDDAAWGRVNIVEFPNSHLSDEDVTIKQAFKTERYQQALLAWLISGAMAMYRWGNAATSSPASMMEARQQQRNLIDNVGQWLDECCETDSAAFVTNAKIRESYEGWCKDNGYIARGMKALTQSLQRRGLQAGVPKKVEGRTERGAVGLRILR